MMNWLENNSILSEIPIKEEPFRSNLSYYTSPAQPVNRSFFFNQLIKNGFHEAWKNTVSTKLTDRVLRKIYQFYENSHCHITSTYQLWRNFTGLCPTDRVAANGT